MNLIKEINIKYFRSIYNLKLKDLNDCIIFSGKNDVGKSNVLKALNLFFNNQTDWQSSFNFSNDFNFQRLAEVRDVSIKGKQFIQIEIKFRRGSSFNNTLPEEFSVKRTWDRNSDQPKESDDLERKLNLGQINNSNIKIIRRSLTQFLNKIKFAYVPVIKDQRLFSHLLNELQDEIFIQLTKKGKEISEEIGQISSKYSDSVISLKEEFKKSTGIQSELSLPLKANELFKVLSIVTDFDETGGTRLNLDFRGDGIRLRYIPSLYNFLAQNYRGNYLLGFEEPENSMEYGLGSKMASEFFNNYSKNAQIFITSHSPSFLKSTNENVDYFRIFQDYHTTNAVRLKLSGDLFSLDKSNINNAKLTEELGLTELQREFHKQYEERFEQAEKNIQIIQLLNEQIKEFTIPVIYTEGKTDVTILKNAWNKLYPEELMPFEILPVETTTEKGGDGGYGALNRKLESVKPNEKLQIGLYDRDKAGLKEGFNRLNRNLIVIPDKPYLKRHKNGKSFAFILPPQDGLERFIECTNLPIEFLFSEEDLNKKDPNGNGLVMIPFQGNISFGDIVIETIRRNDIFLCSINKNSKIIFAEKIVPSLERESFSKFDFIFNAILKIISGNIE